MAGLVGQPRSLIDWQRRKARSWGRRRTWPSTTTPPSSRPPTAPRKSSKTYVQIVARVSGWWLKGCKFKSCQEGRESFLFQSEVSVLILVLCLLHSRVFAGAHKRPCSFCQKCRWQVTPKHAYTLDPTKLELADYASCPGFVWGSIMEMSSQVTHQGKLSYSPLSSLSHCGLALA